MSSQPSIAGLASGQTVLVLGAGASMDYGFPSWSQLQAQVATMLADAANGNDIARLLDRQIAGANAETLEAMADDIRNLPDGTTIDAYVESLADDRKAHALPLFRLAVGTILLNAEAQDAASNRCRWIETLAARIAPLVTDGPLDLRVITLNYERCFEHRFLQAWSNLSDVWEGERPHDHKYDRRLTVAHPHGAIGRLPDDPAINLQLSWTRLPSATNVRPDVRVVYGDRQAASPELPIFPIDTINGAPQSDAGRGYSMGEIFSTADGNKDAILTGMSYDGLANSRLEFTNCAEIKIATNDEASFNELDRTNYKHHRDKQTEISFQEGYAMEAICSLPIRYHPQGSHQRLFAWSRSGRLL